MAKYVKMGLGFVRNTAALSKLIAVSTVRWWKVWSKKARKKTPSHVYIWFEDVSGHRVYFEALEGVGWRGPLPIENFEEWLGEDEGRWVQDYDLTKWMKGDVQRQFDFCMDMKDPDYGWVYDTERLALHTRFLGCIGRLFIKSTPNKVICSEAGARVCYSTRLDFREWCKVKQFDNISPAKLLWGVRRLFGETNTVVDVARGWLVDKFKKEKDEEEEKTEV